MADELCLSFICIHIWWHGKSEDLEISAGLISCVLAAVEEQMYGVQVPSEMILQDLPLK